MATLILLLIIAGLAKAWSDALSDEEIKENDWHNKYDFTKPGEFNHWWYFGLYKPKYPEKFPFSSTILVFITDRWHLSQFIMLRSFYTAIATSLTDNFWLIMFSIFIIFPITLGIAFEAGYNQIREHYKSSKKMKK
jgi:hypothetical protein